MRVSIKFYNWPSVIIFRILILISQLNIQFETLKRIIIKTSEDFLKEEIFQFFLVCKQFLPMTSSGSD